MKTARVAVFQGNVLRFEKLGNKMIRSHVRQRGRQSQICVSNTTTSSVVPPPKQIGNCQICSLDATDSQGGNLQVCRDEGRLKEQIIEKKKEEYKEYAVGGGGGF